MHRSHQGIIVHRQKTNKLILVTDVIAFILSIYITLWTNYQRSTDRRVFAVSQTMNPPVVHITRQSSCVTTTAYYPWRITASGVGGNPVPGPVLGGGVNLSLVLSGLVTQSLVLSGEGNPVTVPVQGVTRYYV